MTYLLIATFLSLATPFVLAQSAPAGKVRSERGQIENERRPNVKKLYELIRSADRLTVTFGSDGEQTTLYESTHRRDIDELHAALRLTIPKGWWLSVCADPTITLYKDGKVLAYIGDVSGREVKTSVWGANALISDQERWLKWFDQRGITVVRKERDHAIEMDRQYAKDRARWNRAMPRGIKVAYERQLARFSLPGMEDTTSIMKSLERAYPNKEARIRAVLFWYGSGSGSWSAHPSYEGIVGSILLEFSTPEIIKAINFHPLTKDHFAGAARHFASWEFDQKRPEEVKLIPRDLRLRLLEHSLSLADKDNRDMAKRAFDF